MQISTLTRDMTRLFTTRSRCPPSKHRQDKRSLSKVGSQRDVVVARKWSWSSVTDREEFVGKISSVSRLPQYLTMNMVLVIKTRSLGFAWLYAGNVDWGRSRCLKEGCHRVCSGREGLSKTVSHRQASCSLLAAMIITWYIVPCCFICFR